MSLNASLVGVGIAQAILYLLFIRFIDLYERESLRYVVPVFIWGFAVATTRAPVLAMCAIFRASSFADISGCVML